MKFLWKISMLIGWATAEWEYTSEEAFTESVNSPVITFVNFDTPSDWCTHCQDFREIWTALIEDTQGMPEIVLLSIDCDANKPLCDSKGASDGYPALIAFQNGDEINKFPDTAQRTQIALSASIGQMIDDYSVSQLVEANGIMFKIETGRFIQGNKLMDDFWVGSVDDEETACRNACVDNVPECHAYSVKVQDPMKGQCYLKTETTIEQTDYDFVTAPYYSSGVITSVQFRHCKSNIYGKNAEYEEGKPESGCWTYNPETRNCEVKNPDCLQIQCSNTTMTGWVRQDVFHDESLVNNGTIVRPVLFNRQELAECQEKIVFDVATNKFKFVLDLAACAMHTEAKEVDGEGYIKFSQEISFKDPATNDFGIYLAGFYTGSVGFHCLYRSSTSGETDFNIVTRIFDGKIEEYVNWDYTSELKFYANNNFTDSIENQKFAQKIGKDVYFSSSWTLNFVELFPVVFYPNKCTVISAEENNEYAIIKDGCGSILADAKMWNGNSSDPTLSNSIYQPKNGKFSFRSFSFSQGQSTYSLRLVCTLNFCLKDDIENGSCGIGRECPAGYRSFTAINGN